MTDQTPEQRDRSSQPGAILRDSEKAVRMYRDSRRVPDRFGDDIDCIEFWVRMVEIMRPELVKALGS